MLSRILRLFDLRRKPVNDPSRDLSDGDEPYLANEVRAALDPDYCGWVDCPADPECGAPPAPHVPAGRFVVAPTGGGDPFVNGRK